MPVTKETTRLPIGGLQSIACGDGWSRTREKVVRRVRGVAAVARPPRTGGGSDRIE